MKFVTFMFVVPIVAGVLSSVFGIQFLEQPVKYLLINAPICVISAGIALS